MALIEKSITVASAELKKSGVTNGKAWTIYKIVDQDGKKYTTFEKELAQLGVPAHIFYEETERDWVNPEGKTIKVKDRTIRKFQIGAEFQSAPKPETKQDDPLISGLVDQVTKLTEFCRGLGMK